MKLYAAYGTNLDPALMAERAPCSPVVGTGWLHGWRLTFGGADLEWEGSLATVVEDPTATTFVALYHMDDNDAATLDQWEGVPIGLYRKIKVRVATLDGDELASVYTLDEYEGGLPTASNLGAIADAAQAAGAPDDYVHAIRMMPCM